MSSVLEGDQLRLSDGSLWVVKGCYHPPDGIVAVPRLFEGGRFKRLREIQDVLLRYYRHYMRFLPALGRMVPVVPRHAVVEYLSSFEAVRRVSKGVSRLHDVALDLSELLSACGFECGLSGSLLGGYFTQDSDVDLVCTELVTSGYRCLEYMRRSGITKGLTGGEALEEVSSVSELIPSRSHEELLTRKLTQGTFKGVKYTLRVLDCREEGRLLGPYIMTREERVLVRLTSTTYRTPAVYAVELLRPQSFRGLETYLLSYRARLTELPPGTIIKGSGLMHLRLEDKTAVINLDTPESTLEFLTTQRAY